LKFLGLKVGKPEDRFLVQTAKFLEGAMTIKKTFDPFQSPVTAVLVLGLLVVATIGVRARVWRGARPSTSDPQQLTTAHGPVQVVRFTLYDSGIFPQQAYAQQGLVTIAVEDLSGGMMGLVVERETGQVRERVGQVRRKERQRHGKDELRLEPGRYQLYMADRPDDRAELIVAP
jgi:hypothetical protein